jgi:hypothetical protein
LHDYVGPPRFQFPESTRRTYEQIVQRDSERIGATRRVTWLDTSDLSPFCGVRSDEILPVLRAYLSEVAVREANPLFVCPVRSRIEVISSGPRPLARRVRSAIMRKARRMRPGRRL